MTDTLSIPHRFRGPPDSGNGGWVAGRLAASIPGAATVRLHAPPPLETDLALEPTDGVIRLVHEDRLLAEARPGKLALDPPVPPDFAAAAACEPGYVGFHTHPLPGCFVCGTARGEGDGLRIFAAPWNAHVAAAWTPDASLSGTDGAVDPAIVWAALDCPGAFSFTNPPGRYCLLGELTARLHGSIAVGERCVIVGWLIGREGRKRFTGTAVFGEDAALRGLSRATWIELAA